MPTKRPVQAGISSTNVHLPHCYDGDRDRVVLEGYPGMAARSLIGRVSYKNDDPAKQTEARLAARHRILADLLHGRCAEIYGFALRAPMRFAQDAAGDELDAVLCAVQAAWGWRHRDQHFGAPVGYDRLEGWVCDPSLARLTKPGP